MATINSIDSNIPIEISKGGTNATSFATTDGTVYYNGTSLVTTATGTAGQVLTSGGAGVAPSYTSAGNWVLIQSQTANNTSPNLDFTTGITSTYTTYALVLTNVINASGNPNLDLLVSTDGGGTWKATGYVSCLGPVANNTTAAIGAFNNNTTSFVLGATTTNSPAVGVSGTVYLYGLTNGSNPSISGTVTWIRVNPDMWTGSVGGYTTNTTVNGLRITYTSVNITSGRVSLFGIKEF